MQRVPKLQTILFLSVANVYLLLPADCPADLQTNVLYVCVFLFARVRHTFRKVGRLCIFYYFKSKRQTTHKKCAFQIQVPVHDFHIHATFYLFFEIRLYTHKTQRRYTAEHSTKVDQIKTYLIYFQFLQV